MSSVVSFHACFLSSESSKALNPADTYVSSSVGFLMIESFHLSIQPYVIRI